MAVAVRLVPDRRGGGGSILARNELAVAEGRGTGDDDGQRPASPARYGTAARMCSLNRNIPSRLADSGSRIVNPGCDAASGPAASAWEASSMVAAPTTTRTYGDQLAKMAPIPSPRCELSSLITAATKPHEIPVAAPSSAARRDRDAPGR